MRSLLQPLFGDWIGMVRYSTHQSLHGTVQSVSVVAAELGVDTLERGVTVSLGLLDTVRGKNHISALLSLNIA